VLAPIIGGFLIFGQRFIYYWVGPDFALSYVIACILMVPLTLPLLQSTGLQILQAKSKNRFRSLVAFVICFLNIAISIPLARLYGGIGPAIGTAFSLIIGQIIIMNLYYHKKIGLDMILFWKEILKMSMPIVASAITIKILLLFWKDSNILMFLLQIVLMLALYVALMWRFGMNDFEKSMVRGVLKKHNLNQEGALCHGTVDKHNCTGL
jgi:O-antigen/teichoic acid export membrane protein